jgi:hypothetical protein
MAKTIPPEHRLPCDFIVGHIRFRKGVALETVRKAAERWLKVSGQESGMNLRELAEKITPDNRHPEILND